MKTNTMVAAALAAGISLVGCGGDSPPAPLGPRAVNVIAIPNVGAGTNFSFDLGVVVNHAPTPPFYAFTDRNNKSVDRIDIATQSLTKQITGSGATAFAGIGAPRSACTVIRRCSSTHALLHLATRRLYCRHPA